MLVIWRVVPHHRETRIRLHAAVVEIINLDDAEVKYAVQNWYPGDEGGRVYNFGEAWNLPQAFKN